jgi:lysophospholipase L1-like esterase
VKWSAVGLVAVIAAMLLEVGARLIYAYDDEIKSMLVVAPLFSQDLDPFEMPSPKAGAHWILRPGYRVTFADFLDDKTKAGRNLPARLLGSRGPDHQFLFRINRHGFKGPEIDSTHKKVRILALGDSTTFGLGPYEYPRALESALAAHGKPAEVINGGVEGYVARNILLEMDRYLAVKPDIVTLMIGWNSIFSDIPWSDSWEVRVRFFWLVKKAWGVLRSRSDLHSRAVSSFQKPLRAIQDSPEVTGLENYILREAGRIETIIDNLLSSGATVVLLTLPGLFTLDESPSQRALTIGHLPEFTDNVYVLAKLTDRVNLWIRRVAERRKIKLVDLAEWSRTSFRPRDRYFMDSVHMTAEAMNMIGAHIANELSGLVDDIGRRRDRGHR